ncbi:hypothetical protein [Alkalithermobacter paradoxus]|uniref:Uncharacterized protein n=1 Tax=Alkalithermobacter paradoxus TaxID=29349 RepID=A0A1V4IAY4_9FIRM|nr:hypothetical protein CLOTH_04350 [[Clostridium] thermoalcaliphilum]
MKSNIATLGKITTSLGVVLSIIVASRHSYLGNFNEIVICGLIGLINIYSFIVFDKHSQA